ncbi:MAG: phage holin family protein, partial [Cruoricaptor ignavus]|nr:phage holin family protein [Cruoricaptor ignavus]
MNLVIRLLITAGSAYLLQNILSGVHFSDFATALVFAIVLGLLNIFVTPIFKILGLPITIFTLG